MGLVELVVVVVLKGARAVGGYLARECMRSRRGGGASR